MIRLIKRYGGGSRKLYDTEESRYASLEEIAGWIRQGQQLRIVDSKTAEDVTAATLAQVIYEGEKRGMSFLSGDFLHEIIRRGGQAVSDQVDQIQARVDRMVGALPPVRRARGEIVALRKSLTELERLVGALEDPKEGAPVRARKGATA
ncbi:MAG TPA: polyhydroxyalkanoate synthesis regulator DNA-binding domain-containing protein [Gemmatimonadales bacterium]|nr:polyhydroxyalkanoate synthesis regulator DNA-binding domain-containing protein [Gemmatimonadales bacterium]